MEKGKIIPVGDKELLFTEIDESNSKEVLELFQVCGDFFKLIGGEVPSETEDYFKDLPPGKTYDEKHLIGVFDDKKLVAAIDIVEDYPKDKEWIIGLLIIHPAYRRMGIGSKIDEVLGEIVVENRGKFLRVGIQEQNKEALKFWLSRGYEEKFTSDPMKIGQLESRVVVMNKKINA